MDFSEIEAFIGGQAQESATLEFKAGPALSSGGGARAEMVKDVTAMANGAGGRIVYGIAERKGDDGRTVADSIHPVGDAKITADWFTQVVATNTGPPLSTFKVSEIAVPGSRTGDRVFVVDVQASTTAHQSGFDHRYYQRIGPIVLPMEDFQIRDVMGRRTAPRIRVALTRTDVQMSGETHRYEFGVRMTNEGVVSLERWRLEMDIPSAAIDQARLAQMIGGISYRSMRHDGRDIHRITRAATSAQIVGAGAADLHPGDSVTLDGSVGLTAIPVVVTQESFNRQLGSEPPIAWRLFMPNSAPVEGTFSFAEWCKF